MSYLTLLPYTTAVVSRCTLAAGTALLPHQLMGGLTAVGPHVLPDPSGDGPAYTYPKGMGWHSSFISLKTSWNVL